MNEGFSYYFCLMIEGNGAGAGSYLVLTDKDPHHWYCTYLLHLSLPSPCQGTDVCYT
jgi:hypothetical protein